MLPAGRAAALLLLACLSACSQAPQAWRQESYVFGTRVELTVYHADPALAQRAAAAVLADLDRWHRQLHAWQPDSELSALNRALAAGQSFAPSAELHSLLQQGRRQEALADGLFAPGIGALVALWGFHADDYRAQRPAAAALQARLALRPTLASLRWQAGRVGSLQPAPQLDLGGMAKGWALDRARQRLLAAGVRSALLNIGGNVIALGQKPDGSPWRVGIRHPRRGEAMASVTLADGEAIGTSGDYQRYFMLDGKRYCHLIDPRDGNAACTRQAVTVIAAAGADAGLRSDVASKPLYFAGPQSGARYAARFALAGWLTVEGDGQAWQDARLASRLQWHLPPTQLHTSTTP